MSKLNEFTAIHGADEPALAKALLCAEACAEVNQPITNGWARLLASAEMRDFRRRQRGRGEGTAVDALYAVFAERFASTNEVPEIVED